MFQAVAFLVLTLASGVAFAADIISVNRAFRRGNWTYRVGAGPVITHAEATILQTKYDGPYRMSGAAQLDLPWC